MKLYDSHSPNPEFRPSPFVSDMNTDVQEALLSRVRPAKPNAPTPHQLISQLPEVATWLRNAMTSRSTRDDDGRGPGGKPGSKPPFRVAYMSAADREVETAAYWADYFQLPITSKAWRVNGIIKGVASDDLGVVYELVDVLLPVVEGFLPEGFMNDPRYGVWQVRSQHFSIWPELAGIFTTPPPATETISDQLELL